MNKTEDLWNSYKDLLHTISKHLASSQQNLVFSEFENTLRKYKQNFFSLLQNLVSNLIRLILYEIS